VKFQVEQIITVKDKTYLLTKSLDANTDFKLSDTCCLGDYEIENWFDIPKALDENGNQLTDKFSFVLKNQSDKEKITSGDVLILADRFVKVVESIYTISGHTFLVLECNTGMLEIGTLLSAETGQQWTIKKNGMTIGRQSDTALQKRIKDERLYFYELDPINYAKKPAVHTVLHVTQNGS
jgi:hypothetical protein